MIQKIGEKEFQTIAAKDAAAVVDFSATWCGPCRMLAPVLEEISGQLEDRVKFYNVDVDESGALAASFGIVSVPTVILLKNGKAAAQSVGFRPAADMKRWIESNL